MRRLAAPVLAVFTAFRSAVIGLTVEAGGKKMDLDVTYRLKNVNRAVPGL
jgi:hypothetical protein